MKRRLSEPNIKESKVSNLLFNKPKVFAEKLKSGVIDEVEDIDQKPAWTDDDDEGFDAKIVPDAKRKGLYKDSLKQKYEVLMGTPSWAKLNKNIDNDENDELLRKVGHLKKTKSLTLPKNFLKVRKFPKICLENSQKQTITCLKFHPTASVALVGSHLGTVSLFSVGGDVNIQLHTFQINKFRPTTVCFTPDGNEAYIASKSNHKYCVYNLIKAEPKMFQLPHVVRTANVFIMSPDGKYIAVSIGHDEVYILSTASKELIRSLKHNNDVESLTFSHDGEKLYCICKQGEICIWNLATYRVIKKFYDDGCVTASCIAISPCGRLLATGSGEGIVNIYETANLDTSVPVPLKTIDNLKTKITNLTFNSSTEILSIASAFYPNALKLVHIPSYHVFSNFPQQGLNFAQIETVAFSPNSGYMAFGNNKGCAFLYRLKYYKNY